MFIVALTPAIGLSFPALLPVFLAVGGALGYKLMIDQKSGGDLNDALQQRMHEMTTVPIRVEETVLASLQDEVKRGDSLHFERDGLLLAIIKDERGRLTVQVSGPLGCEKKQLQDAGEEFTEQIAQLFAYNRAAEVLDRLGATIQQEETNEQGDLVLKVSRWT
jgi:hypothetical protein